jgi:integrase
VIERKFKATEGAEAIGFSHGDFGFVVEALLAEEFQRLLGHVLEPYRTMVLIAGCLGLRAGEIVGLQWGDFDFDGLGLLVQRDIVHGRVGDVKTEYSRDSVPLAPELAAELLVYRASCHVTQSGWLFANPATDKPYHQEGIQKNHIKKAAKAAGITAKVGWKTFRHSYRSWLDDTGAPVGVQRELMRHASIQTTMNVYGRAMTDGKRQALGRVVEILRPVAQNSAEPHSAAIVGYSGLEEVVGCL